MLVGTWPSPESRHRGGAGRLQSGASPRAPKPSTRADSRSLVTIRPAAGAVGSPGEPVSIQVPPIQRRRTPPGVPLSAPRGQNKGEGARGLVPARIWPEPGWVGDGAGGPQGNRDAVPALPELGLQPRRARAPGHRGLRCAARPGGRGPPERGMGQSPGWAYLAASGAPRCPSRRRRGARGRRQLGPRRRRHPGRAGVRARGHRAARAAGGRQLGGRGAGGATGPVPALRLRRPAPPTALSGRSPAPRLLKVCTGAPARPAPAPRAGGCAGRRGPETLRDGRPEEGRRNGHRRGTSPRPCGPPGGCPGRGGDARKVAAVSASRARAHSPLQPGCPRRAVRSRVGAGKRQPGRHLAETGELGGHAKGSRAQPACPRLGGSRPRPPAGTGLGITGIPIAAGEGAEPGRKEGKQEWRGDLGGHSGIPQPVWALILLGSVLQGPGGWCPRAEGARRLVHSLIHSLQLSLFRSSTPRS